MKQRTKALIILTSIASLFTCYLCNRYYAATATANGNIVERLNAAFTALPSVIKRNPFYFSTERNAVISGLVGCALVWLFFLYNLYSAKNLMRGKEHGSSRWGTSRDIKPLTDPVPDLNIPLSATEQIAVGKVKNFESDRNKNIVVVGGSGSGKTYSEIKPSLMQLHSSYVITDPKGTILPDTGDMFRKHGYEVRAFNTIDFTKSLHYNPLSYIRKEKDILKVVNVLIQNTNNDGANAEKFWEDCERLLYTAFIAYLWSEAPPEDQNIPMMIEMLEACEVREEDETFQSAIDIIFEDLEQIKPNCLAVKQYKKFKQAAGKTMKSILISCAARLAPFDVDELRETFMYDELRLDEIGDRKTAFFIIMSDTDSTFAFCIALIMYQMFNLLCEKADNEYGGKLPIHVRCLLDEFRNIGKIPNFDQLISTIRSRNISCMIILQSLTQLSSVYKDNAETIIDCCDSFVFLGGKSVKTTETVAKQIGKTTIDGENYNENRGQNGGYSIQSNILGRDLIDPAEISRLKRSECLVIIVGLPPFRSKKYPTQNHPRYCEIVDGGAPIFDIGHAISTQEKEISKDFVVVQHIKLSELNEL